MYKLQHLLVTFSFCLNGLSQTKIEPCQLADTCIARQDYRGAVNSLKKCIVSAEDPVNYYFKLAKCYRHLEKADSAAITYDALIAIRPTLSEAYYEKAKLLAFFKLYDHSLESFTSALQYAKNDTARIMIFIDRGLSKSSLRQFVDAFNDFDSAYKLDSTSMVVLGNLASIYDELGFKDKSTGYYQKVIKMAPEFGPIYTNYGFLLQRMGKHKEAIENFDKALALMKSDEPYTLCNRSYSKLQLGDKKGAYEDIMKSINLNAINSYAYRVRALVYLARKEKLKACEDLQNALDLGFTEEFGNEVVDLKAKHCK